MYFVGRIPTGVDVVSRKEFWEILKGLKQQGITILVSTPYMDEANLCERIALLQNGSIMSIDRPNNIVKQFPDTLFAMRANDMGRLQNVLRSNKLIKSCFSFGDFHHVTMDSGELTMDNLEKQLIESGFQNVIIKEITPTVEDCFIYLMGNAMEN